MPEPNNPELALRGTDSFTYAFYRHDPQRADHFDVHYHGEYEIIYVPKGSFHYLAGGADYWLRPGEALFLDQYSIHAFLEPAQPCGSYQGILFGKKFLFPSDTNPACRQFYEEIPPQRFSLTQKLTGATPWQQEILALIRRLLHLGRTPEENALPIQISLLTILDILRQEQAYTPIQNHLATQNETVREALFYIRRHFDKKLTVSGIADALHISVNHFIRLFKRLLGATPQKYIQTFRIQQAAALIRQDPSLPLSEVAARTGFPDANYFTRSFKQIMEITPSQYRQTTKMQ